jgi:hypothetical protein
MKVVVIVARGLQAGALGCFGNRWARTPALDAVAAAGAAFDQHFADRADAEGARRAWRGGRYHFPLPAEAAAPAPGQPPDLVRALVERGVDARLVLDASRPLPAGFEEGWAAVERVEPAEGEPGLEATVEAAVAALRALAGRDDWLLWVDLGTALPPWDVPEDFQAPELFPASEEAETDEEDEPEEGPLVPLAGPGEGPIDPRDDALYLGIQAGYAAAVSYLDAGVGELLSALEEVDGGGEVAVLVTADRGLALGEHGVVGPVRAWLHDEVVHLPLLLRLPGGAELGLRVPALTQAVDLAPTLAELFALPFEGAHGTSLLALARGGGEAIRPYACAGLQVGAAIEWALRSPEWALLVTAQGPPDEPPRGPRLYVKPDDRWEVNDVAQHHLELVERLEATLRAFVAETARPGPLRPPALPNLEEEEAEAAAPSPPPPPGPADRTG